MSTQPNSAREHRESILTIEIYRIPYASSVYVDRTPKKALLRVFTSISPAQENEVREMMRAIDYAVPRLGLDGHQVTWSSEDTEPFA